MLTFQHVVDFFFQRDQPMGNVQSSAGGVFGELGDFRFQQFEGRGTFAVTNFFDRRRTRARIDRPPGAGPNVRSGDRPRSAAARHIAAKVRAAASNANQPRRWFMLTAPSPFGSGHLAPPHEHLVRQ